MKLLKTFLPILAMISICCRSQPAASRIVFEAPTLEQEATSIWRTINDFAFLEKQGYQINLPQDSLIDLLITKSKQGTFGNEDFATIYQLLESKHFNQSDYDVAIAQVKEQAGLLNSFLQTINAKRSNWDWDFKMFDQYPIVLTLYGSGGSYDPDEGTVTLLTTREGRFMNYASPAPTIIHEIAHMGMEYSIVRKHELPHGLKERIVDTFVYLMFKEELPEYRIQQMGDQRIDAYLSEPSDINSLDAILSKFMSDL